MKLLKPLSKAQWKRINTGLATTAPTIVLFAIAAVFVPETDGLDPLIQSFLLSYFSFMACYSLLLLLY